MHAHAASLPQPARHRVSIPHAGSTPAAVTDQSPAAIAAELAARPWPQAVTSTPLPAGFSLHPAGAPGLPPVPEPAAPAGFKLTGGENSDRNMPTSDLEHPPRPLGVQSGIAWEPRTATRSYFMKNLTIEFLERLDPFPQVQNLAAAAVRMVVNLTGKTKNDAPVPADVPDPAGAWKF